MSGITKVFIILMLVLSVCVAVATATLYAVRIDWKEQADRSAKAAGEAQAKLQQAVVDHAAGLERAQAATKQEQADHSLTSKQLDLAMTARTTVMLQYRALSIEVTDIRTTLDGLETRYLRLEQDRDDLRGRLDDMSAQLTEAQNVREAAVKEAIALTEQVADLQDKASELRLALIEAREAGVGSPGVGQDVPPLDGVVLTISDGLIGISLGSDDKVDVGHVFTVYRGDEYVSQVRIISVDPKASVARELTELRAVPIKRNDGVSNHIGAPVSEVD